MLFHICLPPREEKIFIFPYNVAQWRRPGKMQMGKTLRAMAKTFDFNCYLNIFVIRSMEEYLWSDFN